MMDPAIFIMDAGLWKDAQEEFAIKKAYTFLYLKKSL